MSNSDKIKLNFLPKPNSDLYSILKKSIPLWTFGAEEKDLRKGFYSVTSKLSAQYSEFKELALGLSFWDWQQFPLHSSMSKNLGEALSGNSAQLDAIKRLIKLSSQPAGDKLPLSEIQPLLGSGDQALIIRHLMPLLRGEHALLWLGESWEKLLRLGIPDIARTALDLTNWPQGTEALQTRLRAELAFLYNGYDEALLEVEKLDDEIWPLWKNYIKAELLSRNGETMEAAAILSKLWKAMPWQVNWTLKLHALLNPISTKDALEESSEVSILIYSWNNAKLIKNTLENVSHSNIGGAKVFALNNGSSDETAEIMKNAAGLFAEGQYKDIQLPVNVGAPAARNWLLSLPEVRKGKWAVFLDDDVNLPDNWLVELLATAKHYQNPGAIGCRITSASAPITLQSADYHLFQPGDGSSQINGLSEFIMVHDNCRSALDYGQFTYCRPALHVSGCCHMLSLDAINSHGAFDVRFNPTQFDDLERDLRAYLGGKRHIYAGQLAIRHIQHSSLAKAATTKSMAQVFGNKIKLEGLFNKEELNTMAARDLAELWQDIQEKLKDLNSQLR